MVGICVAGGSMLTEQDQFKKKTNQHGLTSSLDPKTPISFLEELLSPLNLQAKFLTDSWIQVFQVTVILLLLITMRKSMVNVQKEDYQVLVSMVKMSLSLDLSVS
ncbi:unnamed protein product [Ambrosiozyma monospora]|uniref:Unnamed protein product n=1 Tax=Ambrosiozyma monospora TaxID=43982 RepID=A0ACB5T6T0_AMBMO|nr:unnamed protein product [Ambrosiozyma monospora]